MTWHVDHLGLVSLFSSLSSASRAGSDPFTHVYTTSIGNSGHMLQGRRGRSGEGGRGAVGTIQPHNC